MPGSGGTQTRAFYYDQRGFLQSESHPELGSAGYGATSYSGSYDARGHAHRKITGAANGPFDLSFAFDAAERVTSVSQTGSGQTVKLFAYDDPTGQAYSQCANNRCNGKLAATARFHYDPDLGTIAVSESYQYDSATGRPARRDRSVGSTGSFVGDSFFFSQTYNNLGDLNTITYPCRSLANGACNPADRVARVMQYVNGFLASAVDLGGTQWASAISYQSNGLVDTVTHGIGSTATKETWIGDTLGMPRPQSIAMSDANNATLWTTGNYAYDGAGNVKQINQTSYAYDALGRLRSWTETPQQGSFSTTTLGLDTFGNRLYETYSFCGTDSNGVQHCGGSDIAPRQIAGTTNHYASMTYDDAGNVTNDGARTFAYDPLNMMTQAKVGGRDFRYLYTAHDERIAVVERRLMGGTFRNKTTWTERNVANQVLSQWTDDCHVLLMLGRVQSVDLDRLVLNDATNFRNLVGTRVVAVPISAATIIARSL